jgi:hypothetical protein
MHHKTISFVPPWGWGVIAGRFSAFSGSSWNRRAMEYICLFFWLALSLLCRKKKTGYFLFFPFLPLSFFFCCWGRIPLQLLASAIPYFFFESLLTTLMLFNCLFCGCRYGNNENNVLIGGFSTGWFYVAHVMSSVALRSVLSDFLSRRCSVCSYVRT